MNIIALLTRGYLCPVGTPDGEIVIGEGPEIVDLDELVPEIVRGEADDEEECP